MVSACDKKAISYNLTMNKLSILAIAALLLVPLTALNAGEAPITLWPQGAPGALGTTASWLSCVVLLLCCC